MSSSPIKKGARPGEPLTPSRVQGQEKLARADEAGDEASGCAIFTNGNKAWS